MMRYNEYKMVSSDQTQQVYAIMPTNSTTLNVRQFEGRSRMIHTVSSSAGAMGSLLTKLDMLLDPGCRLPKAVRSSVQLLKCDLEEVATYLEDLLKVDDPHLMAKCWMKEVRELSYDIEDYTCDIEDNIKCVRSIHLNRKARFICKVNHLKINGAPRRLKWHQQIRNRVSKFRIYVQEAIERYERYDIHCCTDRHRYVCIGSMLPTPYDQIANLVIDRRTSEFIKRLANDGDQKLKMVSIVGCGGIGKTTLAKFFYTKFGGQFDCRAFIQVPQKPNMKSLFCDIISQVQQNNPRDDCKEFELIDNIRRHLQDKRYLIIIDNLSAASVWDILNQGFPENTQRSRIITTTRIKDVALNCCLQHLEYIFEMKPLEDNYSRKLFFNRLFGSESDCPRRLKEVSNKIVQICGGLPLALVIMASLLASQPVVSMELWTYICDTLSPDLWTDSTSDGIKQVLNLCYNNLPHYLKTCLLYLNMYPEGYKISKDALVKTWVAEGFIDAPKDLDVDKVAQSYFDELIGRRFIQPIQINYNDEVSSCTVHDLVRDLIAYKSVEENFIVTIECYRKNVVLIDMVRRLSLDFSDSKYAKVPANIERSQVRSLAFFGLFMCMPSITDFKLLRVLNLQLFGHLGDNTVDLTGISKLFQLKFLKITCNIGIELPLQMRGLKVLETVDMDTKVAAVPWDLFHLPGLLHLHLLLETNLLHSIAQMKSAMTLGSLDLSSNSSQGNMNNLQAIHLTCSTLPSEHLQRNMEALGCLLGTVGNLKTLAIVSGNYQKFDMFPGTSDATVSWDFLAPPPFLQRFEWQLHDCIFSQVPKWIGELSNLSILNIAVREFVNNHVDILRGLPALVSLSLNVHRESIEKVIFDRGGFSVLEYLEFCCTAPWLKFESNAMPSLRKLKLDFNAPRENIHGTAPISIEFLSSLKEIYAKIRGGGGGAESALTSVVINHPTNPRINLQLVDWISYDDEDNEHTIPSIGMADQFQEMVSGDSHDVRSSTRPNHVLDSIILEGILQLLTTAHDRNTASLVCRYWYHTEAETRHELFIGNCYAVSPSRVIERFRGLRSITLKGRPRFADFTLVPKGWGAYTTPWVSALGPAYPHLERIFLKRMTVTDNDLMLMAQSFPKLRELKLVSCDKFSATGLAIIAGQCRHLCVLDLINDRIEDTVNEQVDWISMFPQPSTSLESLMFECVDTPCNFQALEALVLRSPALRRLRVNHHVTVEQLCCLMAIAPNLTHLGTGVFRSRTGYPAGEAPTSVSDLATSFAACKSLISLSGFLDMNPEYLPAIYPVCANLTSLVLISMSITAQQLTPIIQCCGKLQTLCVSHTVGDDALCAVAKTCFDLRVLRVFRLFASSRYDLSVSDVGLEAIARRCRKLENLTYYCGSMTNAAMIIVSNNCPHLEAFRLCILRTHLPDRITGEPMDEGFGAIVMNCKKLCRLSTSGLVTDKAFAYIGQYGKFLKTLSVAFSGNTDMSLRYVFEGCTRLQKLEVRGGPFGDEGLLSGLNRFCNMRSLWMSSCRITMRGCRDVARQMPHLVLEVISGHSGNEEVTADTVDHLYLYRSLAGPRDDAPPFVNIL
ncbi:disease resistance protein RGA5-like [Oryza brachyantha]|nr:disease resistance protein RGA5-like [Oryza brachyantha]